MKILVIDNFNIYHRSLKKIIIYIEIICISFSKLMCSIKQQMKNKCIEFFTQIWHYIMNLINVAPNGQRDIIGQDLRKAKWENFRNTVSPGNIKATHFVKLFNNVIFFSLVLILFQILRNISSSKWIYMTYKTLESWQLYTYINICIRILLIKKQLFHLICVTHKNFKLIAFAAYYLWYLWMRKMKRKKIFEL